VIFFHTDGDELCAVCDILEFFGHASGLGTNFTKCSVSPVSCSEEKAARAVVVMECELAPCPFKFLGIPLAIIRLPCEAYQPVIDRIADKLPTWKASMMPRAGRPALIKSVLAAIPLHQLIVLSLNKKARKQANKILRMGGQEGCEGWTLSCQLGQGCQAVLVRWFGHPRPCTEGHQPPCPLVCSSPGMKVRCSISPA
jgi:hypothetical protein